MRFREVLVPTIDAVFVIRGALKLIDVFGMFGDVVCKLVLILKSAVCLGAQCRDERK